MWLVKDSSGRLCCAVFYTVIFSSSGIVVWTGFLPMLETGLLRSSVYLWVYIGLVLLSVLSHFRCMTTEPGSLPPNSVTREQDRASSRFCTKCLTLKVMRAHHCSVCNKCVIRMDHHCPWVNNCIGIRTARLYLLFVLYLFVSCWVSVACMVAKTVLCFSQTEEELCETGRDVRIFAGFYAFFMCLSFGCFLGFLLYDQTMHAVTGTTGIENLQKVGFSNVTGR